MLLLAWLSQEIQQTLSILAKSSRECVIEKRLVKELITRSVVNQHMLRSHRSCIVAPRIDDVLWSCQRLAFAHRLCKPINHIVPSRDAPKKLTDKILLAFPIVIVQIANTIKRTVWVPLQKQRKMKGKR